MGAIQKNIEADDFQDVRFLGNPGRSLPVKNRDFNRDIIVQFLKDQLSRPELHHVGLYNFHDGKR